jgi:hypothetical protein
VRGDPAATRELETVLLGPFPDLPGLTGVGRLAARSGPGAPLHPAADPASRLDVFREAVPQPLGIRLGQVDLVGDPVQTEEDCRDVV